MQGKLLGFDNMAALILTDAVERVFSAGAGVETVPLGLYILRGESVLVVGLLDEGADAGIDWNTVSAAPLQSLLRRGY